MNHKKIVTLILVFSMLLSCVSGMPVKTMAENFIGTYNIADFTLESDCNKINSDNTAYCTDFGYESDTSLLWTVDSSFDYPVDPKIDFTAWDEIHIRYKAAVRYQRFNIGFSGSAEYDSSSYEYVSVMTLGQWQETTINISEISDCFASSESGNGVSFIRFDASSGAALSGSAFYVDKIWLVSNEVGTAMNVTGASVKEGEMYLPGDIDGTKTIQFEFDKNLYDTDYSDAVELYEISGGTREPALMTYSTQVNQNALSVCFDDSLNVGSAYELVLKAGCIFSAKGAELKEDYILSFGIGIGNLSVESVHPENGTENIDAHLPGFEVSFGFNAALDDAELKDYITITENGKKYSGNYTVSTPVNELIIAFENSLSDSSTYEIILSGELKDVIGGKLTQDYTVSFSTCSSTWYVDTDGTVFSADNADDVLFALENGAEMTSSNARCFESTALYSGKSGDVFEIPLFEGMSDLSDYAYINCFIFVPGDSDEKITLTLESEDSKMSRTLEAGKTGWNMISSKLSSFSGYSGTDLTHINAISLAIGENAIPSEDAFVQIGKVWLSENNVGVKPAAVKSEYGTEEGNVASNLGGDNAFTIEFSEEISFITNELTVEKSDGGEFKPYSAYKASADDKNLNITFEPKLAEGDYIRITLNPGSVYTANLVANEDYLISSFCIESDVPVFRIIEVSLSESEIYSPADVSEFVIKFNSDVHPDLNPESYIFLYADGKRVYGAFDAVVSPGSVTLEFTSELLPATEYKVIVDSKYRSAKGYVLSGENEFSFRTAEVAGGNTVTVFSADNQAMLEAGVKSGGKINSTGLNLYEQNIAFPITAGRSQTFSVQKAAVDVSQMKYLNIYIYVEKDAAGSVVNIPIYYEGSKYYLTTATLKEGWNLVSKPLSNISSPNGWSHIEKTNLEFGGWSRPWKVSTEVLIDKIWYSDTLPESPVLLSQSIPDGYEGAACEGEKITLKFSQKLYAESPFEITLSDANGNNFEDYLCEIKDNTLTLSLGKLSADTVYNVSIDKLFSESYAKLADKIDFSFKTAASGIFVTDDISIEQTNAGTYIAEFDIQNSTSAEAKLNLNIILYDANGFVKVHSDKEINIAPGNKVSESIESTTADAVSAKAFVTDENGNVVAGKFSEYKSGALTSNAPAVVSGEGDIEIKANADVVVLTLKPCAGIDTAVVSLLSPNGDRLVYEPISFKQENKHMLYYDFAGTLVTGTYTAILEMNGKTCTSKLHLLSDTEKEDVLTLSNSGSKEQIKAVLKKYGYVNSDVNSTLLSDYAAIIISNRPYYDADIAYKKIGEITSVLEDINSVYWSDFAKYISDNCTLIFDKTDMDAFEEFEALVSRDQNEICMSLSKKRPFDSLSDFCSEIGKLVDDIKSSGKESSNSGKGGSGGGGSKTPVSYPIVDSTVVNPGSSNDTAVFTDLAGFEWASESIISLCNKNIVSKPSDRLYRPADNVTREEFVKLLICAFFPDADAESYMFADETVGEWYVPYISAAYSLGIVTGKTDGTFGIGESITRQDMAVMAGRALEARGIKLLGNEQMTFTDTDKISDYAYASVSALAKSGVINGMGDGSFAPMQNANRAQAAVIISRMSDTYR